MVRLIDLQPGQYEIGNTVFGRNTPYPVESFEVSPYTVNGSEYQLSATDENRFGRDYIQPGSIQISMGVVANRLLPNMINMSHLDIMPQIVSGQALLEVLQEEWAADDERLSWGLLKMLRYCNDDGQTRRLYGRPRKFAASSRSRKSEYYTVAADYMRVDRFSYDDEEQAVTVLPSAAGTTTQTISRLDGGAPAWLRVFITGPIVNPKVKFGTGFTLEINTTLAAGKVLEISSYPWERRIVDSDAVNLSAALAGNSPYLSDVRIKPRTTVGVGLSGGGTTAATKAYVLWRETYHTI